MTRHTPPIPMARPIRLLATTALPGTLGHSGNIASGACSTTGVNPFLGLPIGDKRAFPTLTVSASNRSSRDYCCRARTPPPPPLCQAPGRIRVDRQDMETLNVRDVSSHHDPNQGCLNVFGEAKTRLPPAPWRDVMHPHINRIFRPVFPTGWLTCSRVCTPPSIAFSRFGPECTLSTKCSQVTSHRRAVYTCASYEIAPSNASQPNSNCCTPPAHGERPPTSENLERLPSEVHLAGQRVEDRLPGDVE